eukprot:1192286-Rhodomonas_salina.1
MSVPESGAVVHAVSVPHTEGGRPHHGLLPLEREGGLDFVELTLQIVQVLRRRLQKRAQSPSEVFRFCAGRGVRWQSACCPRQMRTVDMRSVRDCAPASSFPCDMSSRP